MPLKTPFFWRYRGILSNTLNVLSYLYLAGYRIKKSLARPYKSRIPVLCVGGIVAGGSGKTPVVHAIISLIRQHQLFENPVILTRGYGGTLRGPTMIDPEVHGAKQAGDEALLHTLHAPTIVSKNRAQGAILAEAMGADVIVMDDGLQNFTLEKTMSFLVIDRRQGLGNGYLLPAGPLREPLAAAVDRCALVIQTNGKGDLPIAKHAVTTSIRVISEHDCTLRYYGFAGLGSPEKFKLTLEENGFNLAGFRPFADHHPYRPVDIEFLRRAAGEARLITTEKDFVRIPDAFRDDIDVVSIEQVFDRPDDILRALEELKR